MVRARDTETRHFASWDMGFIPFAELSDEERKNYFDIRAIGQSDKMREAKQQRSLSALLNSFLSALRRC